MHALNKSCENCHKPMNGGVYRASHVCPHCAHEHEGGKASSKRKMQPHVVSALAAVPDIEFDSSLSDAVDLDFDAVSEPATVDIQYDRARKVAVETHPVGELEYDQDNDYEDLSPISQDPVFTEPTAVDEAEFDEDTTHQTLPLDNAPNMEMSNSSPTAEEKILAQQQELDRLDYPSVEVGSGSLLYDNDQAPDQDDHEEIELGLPESTSQNELKSPSKNKSSTNPTAAAKTAKPADEIVLTSKSADSQQPHRVLKKLKFECALNIKLTPDLFKDGKFIGNKSEKFLAALKQGQKHVLGKLKQEAEKIGANMVTNVTVKNSIRGVDKKTASILVTATGTSIKIEPAFDTANI